MSRLLIPLSFTPKSGGPEGSRTPVLNAFTTNFYTFSYVIFI